MRVKKEFDSARKELLGSLKRITKGDMVMRPADLVEWIITELGDKFASSMGIQKQLQNLLAYLAEDDPKQISIKKLELAFSYRESDPPLE